MDMRGRATISNNIPNRSALSTTVGGFAVVGMVRVFPLAALHRWRGRITIFKNYDSYELFSTQKRKFRYPSKWDLIRDSGADVAALAQDT